MKSLILTVFCLAIPLLAFAKKREHQPILLSPNDTLHIQVMEYLGMYEDVGSDYRFYEFKQTLEEVLEELDFPMEYEITRLGSNRIPPGQPRLDINILKWGDNGLSQIEARFIASLKKDYDRNKLGVFSFRGGGIFVSTEQMRLVYNDVLRKALVEMMTELNERLAVGDGSEARQIEEGSGSEGQAGE